MFYPFPGAEHCGRRKRRALNDDVIVLPDDGDTAVYDYKPDPFTVNEQSFPTPTGKAEQDAIKTCSNNIRGSFIGKACLNTIEGFDIQDYIDQCVTDVRVSYMHIRSKDSCTETLL